MSIFRCEGCGCVENTALSRYWFRNEEKELTDGRALCSECHPTTKKWHGVFPKQSADGYLLGNDGFLYRKGEDFSWREKHQGFRILGEVGL